MRKEKSTLKIAGLIVTALLISSCRNLNADAEKALLTCASSSVGYTQGAEMGLMDPALGGNELAQSFKPQATVKNVASVELGLQLVTTGFSNNLSGTLTVSILGDRNGVPYGGAPMGQIATLPISKLSTSPKWIKFTFGQPIAELTAKTPYWIVLNGNFNWNSAPHVIWFGSDADGYSDGQALSSNGLGWLNPDAGHANPLNRRDLQFKIGCL